MRISLSESDGAPIYQQITRQVKYLIASGRLAPGEELPSVRALAEQLLVNPNTVARAYRELEMAGVVTKRRATGTYVSEAGQPLDQDDRLDLLADRADALLAEARQMDLGLEEVIDLLRKRHDSTSSRSQKETTHERP